MKITRLNTLLLTVIIAGWIPGAAQGQSAAGGIDPRSATPPALAQEQSRIAEEQVRLVEEQIQIKQQMFILNAQLEQVTTEARTERDRDRRRWLMERQEQLRNDIQKQDERLREMAELRVSLAERQRQIAPLQGRLARDVREQVFARLHMELADARLRISRQQTRMTWEQQLRVGIPEEQKRLTEQQRILAETHALLAPDDAPRNLPLARHHLAESQYKLAQAQEKLDAQQAALEAERDTLQAEVQEIRAARQRLEASGNKNTPEGRERERELENRQRAATGSLSRRIPTALEAVEKKRPDAIRELIALGWLQRALAENMEERRYAEGFLALAEQRERMATEEQRTAEEAKRHRLPQDLDQRLSGIHRRLATQIQRQQEQKRELTAQQLAAAGEIRGQWRDAMVRLGGTVPADPTPAAPKRAPDAAPAAPADTKPGEEDQADVPAT